MEEKKKRWRPSLTAYRALERQMAEMKEEKARLNDKISVLEKSNKLLDEETERLRDVLREAHETIDAMDKEIYALCHRNLWDRIFNK